MKMLLLKTTGEAVEVAADLAAEVERLIGAELLDVVDLRGGRVMFVDDSGQSKGLPVNHDGTELYHSICQAGTTFQASFTAYRQ